MHAGVLIAIYIIGIPIAAVVAGYLDDRTWAALAPAWPVIVIVAVPFACLLGLGALGERIAGRR